MQDHLERFTGREMKNFANNSVKNSLSPDAPAPRRLSTIGGEEIQPLILSYKKRLQRSFQKKSRNGHSPQHYSPFNMDDVQEYHTMTAYELVKAWEQSKQKPQ